MLSLSKQVVVLLFSVLALLANVTSVHGQSKERRFELDRIQWICRLCQKERYHRKFELTDAQISKLRNAYDAIHDARKEIKKNDPLEERNQKIETYRATILKQGDVLKSVLVEHQFDSINYIYHMNNVKDTSYFGLTDPFVVERVQIREDQQKKLKAGSKEAKEELSNELAPLRQKLIEIKLKYRKKMLEQLTPEQRNIYLERFGHLVNDGH